MAEHGDEGEGVGMADDGTAVTEGDGGGLEGD